MQGRSRSATIREVPARSRGQREFFGVRAPSAAPESALTGRSLAFLEALEQASAVAPLDVHVLLLGPSGSGKNKVAHLIHDRSRRSDGPFVEVNCAALPEALIENELFGAVAGAHSTARVAHGGKIAAASCGTLFLDEIGELSLSAQASLLQFLSSGEFWPLGSTQACNADVRVVAASNVDLHEAVRLRRFRADLLYRLEVFPIRMPSLEQRQDDIAELAERFCREASSRHRLPPVRLSMEALEALRNAPWPGNIRQLEHAIEAGVIRAAVAAVAVLTAALLFPASAHAPSATPEAETLDAATRRFQREFLRRTLQECDWNVSSAARRLGIVRSHAYTLIRQCGLERDEDHEKEAR